MVYVREAHPSDGWAVKGWSDRKDPKALDGRKKNAEFTCKTLKFDFPAVLDGMKDEVAIRWSGWPERFFVISKEGKIVYSGEQGPFGFNPSSTYRRGGRPTPGVPLDDFLEAWLKK